MVSNINADLGWILVPTWLHFGVAWAPKIRLGNGLGHLGGIFGPSWERLGSVPSASWGRLRVSWCLLGRLGGVLGVAWGRLGAPRRLQAVSNGASGFSFFSACGVLGAKIAQRPRKANLKP